MFTGIVQAMGKVREVQTRPRMGGLRLVVGHDASWPAAGVKVGAGDSVCVGGVCLTVVEMGGGVVGFDVVPETLAKTTLGELKVGDEVNLETALLATGAVGGHFVQGHVDGVGVVKKVKRQEARGTPGKRQEQAGEWDGDVRVEIEPAPPPDGGLMEYVVPKGSVTIDGVSLTVAEVGEKSFEVALIPTTLRVTTLGKLKVGGRVNLEMDVISKTVVNYLKRMGEKSGRSGGGVTVKMLKRAGFVQR